MIPSNLIVVKYTSGGEFIRADNYADYKGYYYEFNGKTYVGKEYSISAIELLKAGSNKVNTLLTNPSTVVYGAVSGQTIQSIDIVSIPFAPTADDFNKGYIMRYFVKKTNENLIKETNQATYNQVKNDSLYQSIEIKYDILGVNNLDQYDKTVPGLKDFIENIELNSPTDQWNSIYTANNNTEPPPAPPPPPPPQVVTPDTPDSIQGRKAEAPNISLISDSEIDIVKGTFYDNNKKPITLAVVDGKPVGIDMVKPLLLMKRFAKDDKIILRVNSGFRPAYSPGISAVSTKGVKVTAQSQQELYALYKAGQGNPADPPGISKHGLSIAFDLNTGSNNYGNKKITHPVDKEIYQWLIDYAWIFGFVRKVPKEEWHWEYRPGNYQFQYCPKEPNGNEEPWWDGMRLDPTPKTNKRVAEIKAALNAGTSSPTPSAQTQAILGTRRG